MFVGAGMGQSVQKFSSGGGAEAFTANLNGSSQYFNAGDVLNFGTADFSYNFWMKVASGASAVSQGIVNKAHYAGGEKGYSIRLESGAIEFETSDNGNRSRVQGETDLRDDIWHMITCTRDSTNGIAIYIDAVEETYETSQNKTTIRDVDTSQALYLGYGLGAGLFGAYIDADIAIVSVYSALLDSDSRIALYNNGTALCYEDTDQTDMVSFLPLENHTGFAAQELLDQHSSNNLTNVSATPFTGTGLTVECEGLAYFFFTVDTTNAGSASDTIVLPFTTDQNLSIDWGEGGATEDITTAVAATHTYTTGGIYNIRIQETAGGTVKYLKFNSGGDKAKLLDISSWDALDLTENATFYGCSNMTISATNLCVVTTTSFAQMFRGTAIVTIPLIDTSSVTIGTAAFFGTGSMTSIPLLNLSSLTTASSMFSGNGILAFPAIAFTSLLDGSFMWSGASTTSIGAITMPALTDGNLMFNAVTLATTGWSDFLIHLESDNADTDCVLSGGSSKHNAGGATAITALISRTTGWTITDGGAA